jgi:probable F420-dependent oxidoreductase
LLIHAYLKPDLRALPEQVRLIESLGFDGVVSQETGHDPFLPLLLAAEHSTRLRLLSGVAIAFARNPMLLATSAHDLNAFSRGRFTLGLGSQIKAHITRRYSMPWSHPAARMQEMVAAIRAIFAAWYQGQPLNFQGEFYTHTLMTPMFSPADTEFGAPPVWLAAVGSLMTQAAGAVADGLLLHPFTTEAYVRAHTLPGLQAGLAAAGRQRGACRICCCPFLVTGDDAATLERERRAVMQRIAFYASTPAYRPVLDQHGWGELQPRLQMMSREGRWAEMAGLITAEMVETIAVVGAPAQVARIIRQRYGDVADELVLASEVNPPETLAAIAAEIRRMG